MIIKEKSLDKFFSDYLSGDRDPFSRSGLIFPDEMLIINKPDFIIGDNVVFEVNDCARVSDVSIYVLIEYTIEEYDHLHVKLVKKGHKVI